MRKLLLVFFSFLVYASTLAGEETNLRIYRLTNSPYYKSWPCFSSDGKRIAYSMFKEGQEVIYVKALEPGSEALPIPNASGTHPSWFPDGEKILFTSYSGGNPTICLINIDGSGLNELGQGNNPQWSLKGDKIVFARGHNIWLMNSDGSNPQSLTTDLHNDYPCFSPEGERTIFISEGQIKEMEIGSKSIKTVVKESGNSYPVYSPDGQKIALISNRKEGNGERKSYNLWIFDLEGQSWTRITNDADRKYQPCWSPGGDKLVFVKETDNKFNLWCVEGLKQKTELSDF